MIQTLNTNTSHPIIKSGNKNNSILPLDDNNEKKSQNPSKPSKQNPNYETTINLKPEIGNIQLTQAFTDSILKDVNSKNEKLVSEIKSLTQSNKAKDNIISELKNQVARRNNTIERQNEKSEQLKRDGNEKDIIIHLLQLKLQEYKSSNHKIGKEYKKITTNLVSDVTEKLSRLDIATKK